MRHSPYLSELTLLATLLLAVATSFAQDTKGARPTHHSSFIAHHSTRAVVVGISDYQDPAIPDLRFADRDAEAFASWLRSPAGGSLPETQVKTLLNRDATTGKIIAALDALISASKAGDEAIIYFSGHGDVERVTKFQRGYWLTWDSPPTVYAAGAFSLVFLQDIITTLSDNSVQVIVVSDACRAGKLAGSEYGGARATSAALAQQFANEIKILSCQPEEFSLEGEQWGGGRGAFSFHLVDALYGMADANADGTVNLLELGRYLEDRVPAETAPHSQIPFTVGSKATRIAQVDAEALTQWRLQKQNGVPQFAKIDMKGLEEIVLARADSSVRTLYAEFVEALERGDLMEAKDSARRSANALYKVLIREPALADLHGAMTRNFAAALMDEGQQILNRLLKTDEQTIQRIYANDIDFQEMAEKTARAAALLGEGHYAFKSLKTKEYYFRGVRAHENKDAAGAKKFALEALSFDNEAPYVYLSLTHLLEGDSLGMMVNKVEELAPNWVYGQAACAVMLFAKGKYRWSLRHSLKAIALDSGFLIPYWRTAENYRALHLPDSARIWDMALGEKVTDRIMNNRAELFPIECMLGGVSLSNLNRFRDANLIFRKGWELSAALPAYIPTFQRLLASNYANQGRFREALTLFDSISPQDVLTLFYKWGTQRFCLADPKASQKLERTLASRPNLPDMILWTVASQLHQNKQYLLSDSLLQRQLTRNPKNARLLFMYAEMKRCLGDSEGAANYYLQVLQTASPEFHPAENRVPEYLLYLLSLNRLDRKPECDELLETITDGSAKDAWTQYWMACYFCQINELQTAMSHLQSAENSGWNPNFVLTLEGTVYDLLLDPLRHLPEFQAWKKRWSPPYKDYSKN